MALYDTIGNNYASFRRPDPRIAEAIDRALGDAVSVANIGAGAGSYEPVSKKVIAVEPSEVMIRQRSRSAAACLLGSADAIPLEDGSVDAAMAILTIHHWPDLPEKAFRPEFDGFPWRSDEKNAAHHLRGPKIRKTLPCGSCQRLTVETISALHSNGHSKKCNCGVSALADVPKLLHREKIKQRRGGKIRRCLAMSKRMNSHANRPSTRRFTSREVTPRRNHRRCVRILFSGGGGVPEKHK